MTPCRIIDTRTAGGAIATGTTRSFAALSANTTGFNNTATGNAALSANTTGSYNTATGTGALQANTTGGVNSAFGFGVLAANTEGMNNSALGFQALHGMTTGSNNVAVGYFAGGALGSGSYNIYVGSVGAASESGAVRIGEVGTHSATYIAGIPGATSADGVAVYVNSSGKLGTTTSSRRYKEQIADMGAESDVLMQLRPVSFYYRPKVDEAHTRQYGLVAEEVAELAPELVVRDEEGRPQTVRYHFVNAMLLNEVQKQQRRIETQEAEIRELREALARLETRLSR